MALVNYKNIVDRKGYLVDEDDREIFEQELVKTNFGLNIDDHIEFILYDSAENQLPQGDDGKLVRYIPLDDTNIRTYFLATKSNQTKKKNDSFEYFVDVEKLIKEAGYSNGLYKTSVSIVNRRAGKEDPSVNEANKGFDNKLYIQEVSPTRTEIRVLPIKRTGKVNDDLNLRYSIFTRESNFRDDTIYYVNEIIESVKVENVLRNFITSKGKVATGQNYINLIKREFGINNFEDFVRRIEQDWKKSLKYFTENREWRINQNDYGQPLSSPINPELGERQLQEVCRTSLILIIEKYLPKRDYTPRNIMTEDELKTFDKVKQLLRTIRENRELTSSEIKAQQPLIRGCTDPNALNFNVSAQDDDGSCQYRYENIDGNVKEPTPPPPPPPPTTQPPSPPPPPPPRTTQAPTTQPPTTQAPTTQPPTTQPPTTQAPVIVDPPSQPPTPNLNAYTVSRGSGPEQACSSANSGVIWGNSINFEDVSKWFRNSQGQSFNSGAGFYAYEGQYMLVNDNGSRAFVGNCPTTTTTQPPIREVIQPPTIVPPIVDPPIVSPPPPPTTQPPEPTCGELISDNINPNNLTNITCNGNEYVWNKNMGEWILAKREKPDEFGPPRDFQTTKFYIWSPTASIRYIDVGGNPQTFKGTEYQSFTLQYLEIVSKTGDIREEPKLLEVTRTNRGDGGGDSLSDNTPNTPNRPNGITDNIFVRTPNREF